jgi:predicted transcriptional regulator
MKLIRILMGSKSIDQVFEREKIMTLREIVQLIEAEPLTKVVHWEMDIRYVSASDLMSDVLAFAEPNSILLTGLANVHVVNTAEMADVAAVVFIRGKQPPQEVLRLAEEKGKPLFASKQCMFELCGRLHKAGLQGAGLTVF